MSSLILPSRFTRQPQQKVGIDRNNPISRGIIAPFPQFGSTDRYGDVYVEHSQNSYTTKASNAIGVGRKYTANGYNGSSIISFILNQPSAVTRTTMIVGIRGAFSAFSPVIAASNQARVDFDSSGFLQIISNLATTTTTNSSAVGEPFVAFLSGKQTPSGFQAVDLNGFGEVSTVDNSGWSINQPFYVYGGRLGWGGSNHQINAVVVWGRGLTQQERISLAQNPWQLFKRQQRYLFSPVSGGGPITGAILESLGFSESYIAAVLSLASMIESSTAIDAPAASYQTLAAASETVTSTDSQAASYSTQASDVEAVTSVDSQAADSSSSAATIESGSAVDTPAATATMLAASTESAAATDSQNGFNSAGDSVITETAAASDTPAALASMLAATDEVVTATDSPAATATMLAATAETATAVDSPSGSKTTAAAVSDTLTAVDLISALREVTSSALEALTATDSQNGFTGSFQSVIESLSALDTVAASLTATAAITEAAAALDAAIGTLAQSVGVNESGAIADIINAYIGLIVEIAKKGNFLLTKVGQRWVVISPDKQVVRPRRKTILTKE